MTKLFIHTANYIRIVNEGSSPDEFSCAPDTWQLLEPDYPPLPPGKTVRYWTPRYNYVDGDQRENETFDASAYCDKIPVYVGSFPTLWVHVDLSQDRLNVNADPPEEITFSAAIKVTQDGLGDPLPVDDMWFIRLRHEDGFSFDVIRADFVNGSCAYTYKWEEEIPLGFWHLDDSDFDTITVGQNTYIVKLAHPVQFVIHRRLQDVS